MRSSSGPEIFSTYRSTSRSEQVHCARRVPPPAAAAGIHSAHQLEPGRQAQRAARPGDRDLPLLQRLAQSLQYIPSELRKLVQKQHAVSWASETSPGRMAGPPPISADGRGGVVRRAEGPAGQQGVAWGPSAPPRTKRRRSVQGLLPGHVRQDGGQALGQHGLACARGSRSAAGCGRRRRRSPAPASHSPGPSHPAGPAGKPRPPPGVQTGAGESASRPRRWAVSVCTSGTP